MTIAETQRQISLGVTTSTRRGGVAVVRRTASGEPETLALVTYDAADDHAERLFPAIEEALSRASIDKTELSVIGCDVGPGSFTGVRAGTAALSAVAWTLRVPTAPVVSLEAMAWSHRSALRPVFALLDARRGEVFGAVYRRGVAILGPFHAALSDEDLVTRIQAEHDAIVVGEIATRFRSVERFVEAEPPLPPPTAIAELALARADQPEPLAPVYVRAPDAKTTEELARAAGRL